jgi:hypothetical protein
MSVSLIAHLAHTPLAVCIFAGAGWFLLGLFALLAVIGSARLGGPDTAERDPYGVAGRDSDAPAIDLDLALAREAGVVTPDGSHENRSDVDERRWAAELLWLHEQMPEAELLGLEPDAEGDVLSLPIVPGRDFDRAKRRLDGGQP